MQDQASILSWYNPNVYSLRPFFVIFLTKHFIFKTVFKKLLSL